MQLPQEDSFPVRNETASPPSRLSPPIRVKINKKPGARHLSFLPTEWGLFETGNTELD